MTDQATASDTAAPLAGMRILEAGVPAAGPITRFFAELGADVILVPLGDAPADPLRDVIASTGKRILRLDPADAADRAALADLAASADLLVTTRLDGRAAEPLDADFIAAARAANPALVVLAVSPFGRDNAWSGWQLTSSVIDALSGVLSRSGWPERGPLLPPAEIALQCAYTQAAWVALLAYFFRLRTGKGDSIDLSLLEAATQGLDPGYAIGGSATAGVPASQLPRGRPEARHMYPIVRCEDGWVRLCVLAPRQWKGMFEWMGRPEKYADPEFDKLQVRFASKTLLPDIEALFASKTRDELERELEACGVPMAPVLTLQEAIQSAQFVAREATRLVDDGAGRTLRLPNGLIEVDGRRAGVGAIAREIGRGAGWLDPVRFEPAPEASPPERPLSGYTVLDLGVIIAGGEQARLYADQGALTIKLETRAFPDGARQNMTKDPLSVNVAMGHRNKVGLGLNLRSPAGHALFLDLARKADLVLSNFKPGTLASLGLDRPAIAAVNPGIVMGDSSAYGPTGPWRGRPGYGPLVRASSGLTHLWAYPGKGEFSDAVTVYPDHISGRIVATATLALLVRRMRTGAGGETSLAQSEVVPTHLAELVAAASLGEDRPARPDAPWDVYRCAGEDEWCVVTVRDDADWQALCAAMGRADLAARADLATAAGRRAARAELDEAVGAWTAGRGSDAAMASLQGAGVPAGKMLRVAELPDFGYYEARGAYRMSGHPLIDAPFPMENAICRSERIADPAFGPAPQPGEQTDRLVKELLGLSDAEIRALHEAGALETSAVPA